MKFNRAIAILIATGAVAAQAQEVKVNALVEVWYTQMLDNNLRYNAQAKIPNATYYEGLSTGRFQEDMFNIKRSEITLTWKISDELSGNVMFDPNLSTTTVGNNVLQDACLLWNPGQGFNVKIGQFKMPTTYEATILGPKDIFFFDRGQLNRVFGDKRDRGACVSYTYGDVKAFQGKVSFALANGTSDDGSSGKNNDANAQKDYVFRFEGGYTPDHKFGFYYRSGETNLKSSTTVGPTPASTSAWVNGPTTDQILANRDKTTLEGVYYAYDTDQWHADFEYATGLLGRRAPLLFATTPAAAGREYLDQKFVGYALSGVYKMGHHQIAARYDYLNYNSGDDWYTAANPYKPTTGANAGGDFTPRYTETTVGYNYVFNPSKFSLGKVKVDYIMRSKNFLAPRAGQIGEQGGNSLVLSLMIAY